MLKIRPEREHPQSREEEIAGKVKTRVWALSYSPNLVHTIVFKSKYDSDKANWINKLADTAKVTHTKASSSIASLT